MFNVFFSIVKVFMFVYTIQYEQAVAIIKNSHFLTFAVGTNRHGVLGESGGFWWSAGTFQRRGCILGSGRRTNTRTDRASYSR